MKTSALLAIMVVIALAAALIVFSKPAYPMTAEDAKKFFIEDLKEKYPNADVREVMAISNLTDSAGSPYFQLKAQVTSGAATPCPERIHVYYDYPPKNFVSQPPEYITRGCKVCINEPVCILAFPEEAIIASHTYPQTEAAGRFIIENSDASATASFDPASGVWAVRWVSGSSGGGFEVLLSKAQNKVLSVLPIGQ